MAAVLASMPADCNKTALELEPPAGTSGPLGSARRFAATGRAMVAARGPGALLVGLGPRFAKSVSNPAGCTFLL